MKRQGEDQSTKHFVSSACLPVLRSNESSRKWGGQHIVEVAKHTMVLDILPGQKNWDSVFLNCSETFLELPLYSRHGAGCWWHKDEDSVSSESCRKAGDPDTEAYYLHQACRCWTRVLCRPLWECNAGDHLTQALVQAREEVEKYFLGTMSELSLKEWVRRGLSGNRELRAPYCSLAISWTGSWKGMKPER